MRKVIFSIIVITALMMGIFTYAAIKRGVTTGNIIEDFTRFNYSYNYSDISPETLDKHNIAPRNYVKIINFAFSPTETRINVGGTVLWENYDSALHTVTSNDGLFDSGIIKNAGIFSYKFETPGVYAYHCAPHPYMTGKIVVNGR